MEWISANLSYLLLAFLGVFFNVMDSVTTEIGLNRLPDQIQAEEGNPIAKWGLRKHPVLFEIAKHGFVLGLVIYYVIVRFNFGLAFIAVLFGLVVLNNTTTIIMRLITGKRHYSPLFMLTNLMHVPKSTAYILIVIILTALATWIARMITG